MRTASLIRRHADVDDLTAARLNRRTLVRGGLGLVTVAGLGSSVLPAARAGAQAKPGGTVTIGAVAGRLEEGFDPHNSFGNLTSVWMHDLLYDGMLRDDPEGGPLQPVLAESWEVSPDGLIYIFHLRAATFHDGAPITAADVVSSIDRLRASEPPGMVVPALTAEAADERTVIVRPEKPWAPLLWAVGTNAVLPRKHVEEQKNLFFAQPVGSGPFMLAEHEPGARLVLTKHPAYWDTGKPYLDGAEIRIYATAEEAAAAFQAGEIDILPNLPPALRADLAGQPDATIVEGVTGALHGLIISTNVPPFDDPRLRQAMAHAIDRAAIFEQAYQGIGAAATTFMPSTVFGHDGEATGRAYDPERARALVAQSAGKDGFDAGFITMGIWDPKALSMIAEQLAVIGGRVTVPTEFTEVIPPLADGRQPGTLSIFGDPLPPDADMFVRMWVWSGGFGSFITGYANPEADALIEAAATATDEAERAASYGALQALVDEEVPFIPLVYPRTLSAVKKSVGGFRYPFDTPDLAETYRADV